jgi:hypothetical protein
MRNGQDSYSHETPGMLVGFAPQAANREVVQPDPSRRFPLRPAHPWRYRRAIKEGGPGIRLPMGSWKIRRQRKWNNEPETLTESRRASSVETMGVAPPAGGDKCPTTYRGVSREPVGADLVSARAHPASTYWDRAPAIGDDPAYVPGSPAPLYPALRSRRGNRLQDFGPARSA